MQISYKWLNDYIDIADITPQQLQQQLTFAGIEVEKVHTLGAELQPLKVGLVVTCNPHQESDHLNVTTVDFGQGDPVQVVCGAPNCRAGLKVAFAPVGTSIAGFKIKRAKLRGVESFGMICSEKELGLSENHDGIMELAADAPTGTDLSNYLGLSDTVFEVEITPNRPDLLGMIGVAKDLAALLKRPLKVSAPSLPAGQLPATELSVTISAPNACPRYTARVIKGVKVGPSPKWLATKLIAAGLRPINNVVDITNFVMLEYGHPLHAFDLSLVSSGKINVRYAAEGEKFPTLTGETLTLRDADLVIADQDRPIALAGVIGGGNSQISDTTCDVVLESACFDGPHTRRTSRFHKVFTDSSYRFERGMSQRKAAVASARATQLLQELAAGQPAGELIDVWPGQAPAGQVTLRLARVKHVLSIDPTAQQITDMLTGLGLTVAQQNEQTITFSIPDDRADLTREADLLEEIIRLWGYNNVPSRLKSGRVMDVTLHQLKRKLGNLMVARGFWEAVNVAYFDPASLDAMNVSEGHPYRSLARIMNPMGDTFSALRPTLLPGLLKNALHNINHGQKSLCLYEVGKVFTRPEGTVLANETLKLGALLTGRAPDYWNAPEREYDFFDAKGLLEDIFALLALPQPGIAACECSWLVEGIAAEVACGKDIVGEIGRVDTTTLKNLGLEGTFWWLELDLNALAKKAWANNPVYTELPKIQPVSRDLSFVVSKGVSWSELQQTIFKVNPKLIKRVRVFDEYTGKGIENGFRSLSVALELGSNTKTLTDEFILQLLEKIISALKLNHQIQMR